MATPQMTFDPASGYWFDNANGTPPPLGPYIQSAAGTFTLVGGGAGGGNAAAGTNGAAIPGSSDLIATSVAGVLQPVSLTNPLPMYDAYMTPAVAIWTTGTAANTANTATANGYDTAIVSLVTNGSVTGGSVVFEVYDGAAWFPVKAPTIFDYTTVSTVALTASLSKGFQVPVAGFPQFRVRLATAITGAGGTLTVTVIMSSAPDCSLVTVGLDPAQPLPAGTNAIGTVNGPTLTKGTQQAVGFAVQELKDSGRNVSNLFMAGQVVSTAAEVLQSLTGYKGGVAVGATTTPAVVTAGKTYRLQKITITYVAIATAGAILVNLRANLAGVVALGSPLVESWLVGANAATAGVTETITIDFPDGLEFAAGTGIGIGVTGIGATGTAAAVGYAQIALTGFEY